MFSNDAAKGSEDKAIRKVIEPSSEVISATENTCNVLKDLTNALASYI